MMLARMWGCVGKCYFSGVRDRIRANRELGMTRACAQDIQIEDSRNILGKHQSDRSHSGLGKLGNRPQLIIYSDSIILDLVKLYVGLIGRWKIQSYNGL